MKATEDLECSGTGRPFIVGSNSETNQALIFKPDCGNWKCPACAEKKAKVWVLDAFRGAGILQAGGRNVDFVTLTTRGGRGRTRERSINSFRKHWPILRKRAAYYGGPLEYLAIPEQHKNGVVHLHLLITNELSKRWWKDNAYLVGLGFMVAVEPVDHAGEAGLYVAKYLGKQYVHICWPRGFRRARASKGWPRLPAVDRPEGWHYEVFRDWGAVNWEAHLLTDLGYIVKWSDSATNDKLDSTTVL
jgi:hypothetical protein